MNFMGNSAFYFHTVRLFSVFGCGASFDIGAGGVFLNYFTEFIAFTALRLAAMMLGAVSYAIDSR